MKDNTKKERHPSGNFGYRERLKCFRWATILSGSGSRPLRMNMGCMSRGRRSDHFNRTQFVAVLHEISVPRVVGPNLHSVDSVYVKRDTMVVGRCRMTTTSKLRDRQRVIAS